MRLLHRRPDRFPGRPATSRPTSLRGGDSPGGDGQPVSLRGLPAHRRSGPTGGSTYERIAMTALRVEKQRQNGKDSLQVHNPARLPAWGTDAELAIVGRATVRTEGRDKV